MMIKKKFIRFIILLNFFFIISNFKFDLFAQDIDLRTECILNELNDLEGTVSFLENIEYSQEEKNKLRQLLHNIEGSYVFYESEKNLFPQLKINLKISVVNDKDFPFVLRVFGLNGRGSKEDFYFGRHQTLNGNGVEAKSNHNNMLYLISFFDGQTLRRFKAYDFYNCLTENMNKGRPIDRARLDKTLFFEERDNKLFLSFDIRDDYYSYLKTDES
ncbi:hypothetical protein MRY82_01975 [bacterium]|nr:hypothetical protein [bacterium]